MILSERLTLLVLLVAIRKDADGSVIVKRDDAGKSGNQTNGSAVERSFFGGPEEINLEREILQEINHLNPRKQREIFNDLEKQNEKFNVSQRSLVLAETESLSPLNVEELKTIRKTIKASNGSLPAIRNKRTLSFLLRALARAMGYTLTPSNPDAEWIPRQQPPPAQPCTTPPPPCMPNPPSTPPPCAAPPTTPPCPGSQALMQAATIPPNQIDPNTISYPFRPSRTIPLFNFAPLPAGLRVPYPPLLQPPAQQRASCPPAQPSPPPCGAPPASTPAPCQPPSPPPCTTPAPSPPPCGKAPPPSPPPCQSTPAPPCGTTPAPKPPPCQPSPPPPPPCGSTPAPKAPPCQTTPAPPPPCSTPAPSQPPCPPPSPPPCPTPAPPPPPPPPSNPPKKGSILLEYDDPVRIQIFSNDKKYLPASGSIYSGNDEENKQDWHSYFYPVNEKSRKKDEDYEEKEETEEEHIEEEEDEESPGQLKHYEEEDERTLAHNEEEEDESETSLSIVKKPVEKDGRKVQKQRMVTTKSKTSVTNEEKKNEKEGEKQEKGEKTQKMKKPKRKKWIRIVKKQRRKTKTDSNPDNKNNFQIYTSDSFSEASQVAPRYYEKRNSRFAFDSFESDVSDFSGSSDVSSDDSSSSSSEDVRAFDLKKVIVNKKEIKPELIRQGSPYEFNFNPYALEPESERRKKLEKAVERYVEDYVEQQLGNELIKNTGVPKTTVFEFTPKQGPKIQTITTTVAKTTGNLSNFKPKNRPHYKSPTGNTHIVRKSRYEENSKKRGNVSFEGFDARTL